MGNSVLVRDFRPAKKNDIYGFYDLVGKKFYSSLVEPFKPCSNWAEELGYVANGLVGFYDAEFNSVNGHNEDTTIIKNLITPGTYDLTCNGGLQNLYDENEKGFVFPGVTSANISVPALSTLDSGEEVTFELVLKPADVTTTQRILYLPQYMEFYYRNGLNYEMLCDGTRDNYVYADVVSNVLSTMAGTFKASDTKKYYFNGALINSIVISTALTTATAGFIGQGVNQYPAINGSVFYCFRVYNRQLSEDELLQNHNLDKQRFGE